MMQRFSAPQMSPHRKLSALLLVLVPVRMLNMVHERFPSRIDVANILPRVDGRKALGPDGISAIVLRAGGHVLLQHFHDIISASIS